MPKKTEKAAEKPRRRVSVGRKQAEPEVPFDTRVAIEQAIAGLDLEQMRSILLQQEVQLNALRIIVFDFQTILRQETMKRAKPVTKERFNHFVSQLRKTVEANVGDLATAHPNKDEVNEAGIADSEVDGIIEQTFGPLSDWRSVTDEPDEDEDEMEDALERAVADTEDAEIARTRDRRARRREELQEPRRIGPRSSGNRNRRR